MKISRLIFGALGFLVLFIIGKFVPSLTFRPVIISLLALIFIFLTLNDLKFGLLLLIFVVPFTQQVNIGTMGAPVDIGTDDLLIFIIIVGWLVNLAREKEPHFLKTPLNMPLLCYFTLGIFSYVFAGMRFGLYPVLICALHLLKLFEYIMIYFIVVSVVKDLDQVKKYMNMFFIVTAAVLIIQFIAIIRYGSSSLSPPYVGRSNLLFLQGMYSFTSNAIMGAYYCFFLFIVLAILIDAPVFKGKIRLILLAVMLSFGLFNTYSRSAYVGFVVGMFVLSLLKERKLFLVFLMLLLFTPIYMQSAVLERITFTVKSFEPVLILDEASNIRIVLWKRAIQAFLEAPILGSGYWTTRWTISGAEAHSQFLAVLVEGGIIGFSVFVWMLIRMYKAALNLRKNATTFYYRGLGAGYVAGFSAVLASCLTSENLEAFRMIGPLWFITALIVSANRILARQSEKPDMDST